MRSLLLSMALFATVSTASPAFAGGTNFDAKSGDGGYEIEGTQEWNSRGTEDVGLDEDGSGRGVSAPVSGPETWYTFDPYCRSRADLVAEIADYCYGGANSRCQTEDERLYQVMVHTRENPAGTLTSETRCLGGSDAVPTESNEEAAPPVDVVTVSNEDFRSLAIPASELKTQQPVEGHPYYAMSLVGERTNQWAESSEHIIETTILGTPVEVRATPLEYRWDYGNGVTQTTPGPGARRPDHADPYTYPSGTDIVYEETGNYEINLTTVYAGEFRYGDSGWIPISGVAEVASEPKMNTVWKIKARLVAEGCETNADGWACGDDVWQTTPPWMQE
ncbi:hypothetical protein GCM10027591_02700 [Zhihengliuella somnathii]